MKTLKPPRRDVTNTQWGIFTGQWDQFRKDQAAFRTSVTQKLDQIIAQTKPADPPTTP